MYVCMYVSVYVSWIVSICMYVGEVCKYIKVIHNTDQSYVSIKFDMDAIQNLHLNINPAKVKHAFILDRYVLCMYVLIKI